MAKVNLVKLLDDIGDQKFMDMLRDVVQQFAPEAKLGRDDVFNALLERVKRSYSHPVDVSDKAVEA